MFCRIMSLAASSATFVSRGQILCYRVVTAWGAAKNHAMHLIVQGRCGACRVRGIRGSGGRRRRKIASVSHGYISVSRGGNRCGAHRYKINLIEATGFSLPVGILLAFAMVLCRDEWIFRSTTHSKLWLLCRLCRYGAGFYLT